MRRASWEPGQARCFAWRLEPGRKHATNQRPSHIHTSDLLLKGSLFGLQRRAGGPRGDEVAGPGKGGPGDGLRRPAPGRR
jgi:hypothetical protein